MSLRQCGLAHIILAALRRPVVFAKQVATLDNLSNSRLDLGVGVGWQREEYEAAGLDFADRGKLLDHTLEVCQTLWTQQSASHQSVWLRFANIHQMPKPRQDGGVPIWISGRPNRNVIGRLRRFGTGWLPWGMSHDELIDAIPKIRGEVSPIGGRRTPVAVAATVDVTFTADGQLDYHRAFDRVADLRAAGVSDFRIPVAIGVDRSHPMRVRVRTDELAECVARFRAACPAEG